MRAKLYDVLDTKTGVMIGEGLRKEQRRRNAVGNK